MKYDRLRILFGEDFEKFKNTKILLLGVGGVGTFCLDCLYRSGITDITIVDFDTFDVTNQNRQMHSELHEGESKVEGLWWHYTTTTTIDKKIDVEWVESFDFEPYDIILDAIDDFEPKIALIQKCHKKMISSMGSAKKMDPTKIEVIDVFETHGDKFASKIRAELRKREFKGRLTTIFSSEEPLCKEKGSFVGVTGAFGLAMCAETIKQIINKN
ncbi:MAG: tRNA threonylcarbamoyladenosine dehydratase [Helicobacteraceae bacterium]|nr:tRNA threonylcarbamoyladenosine dehydratase [Helicobacteraceae bacterium]